MKKDKTAWIKENLLKVQRAVGIYGLAAVMLVGCSQSNDKQVSNQTNSEVNTVATAESAIYAQNDESTVSWIETKDPDDFTVDELIRANSAYNILEQASEKYIETDAKIYDIEYSDGESGKYAIGVQADPQENIVINNWFTDQGDLRFLRQSSIGSGTSKDLYFEQYKDFGYALSYGRNINKNTEEPEENAENAEKADYDLGFYASNLYDDAVIFYSGTIIDSNYTVIEKPHEVENSNSESDDTSDESDDISDESDDTSDEASKIYTAIIQNEDQTLDIYFDDQLRLVKIDRESGVGPADREYSISIKDGTVDEPSWVQQVKNSSDGLGDKVTCTVVYGENTWTFETYSGLKTYLIISDNVDITAQSNVKLAENETETTQVPLNTDFYVNEDTTFTVVDKA